MNLESMMRQAQEMQKKLQEAQQKMALAEFTGASAGGMIKVIILGNYSVKSINIDESLINKEEKDILEDLIIVALNDAKKKVEDGSTDAIKSITNGMPLPPGFKL